MEKIHYKLSTIVDKVNCIQERFLLDLFKLLEFR